MEMALRMMIPLEDVPRSNTVLVLRRSVDG